MSAFIESIVEEATLAWLEALGYAILHGPDIAAGTLGAERSDSSDLHVVVERNRAVHQCPRQTQFTLGDHG